MFGDDAPTGDEPGLRFLQAQQRASVSLADLIGADRLEDLAGELEQADQVGDRRAVDAQPAGQLLLGTSVSGQVIAECTRFIDRVEILPLEVLHHRQLEDAPIVEIEHPRRDLMEMGLDARAKPPLSGDELEARSRRADEDRLEHAVLAERLGQRRNLIRIEVATGLERIGIDLVNGDLDELGALVRPRFESTFFTPEQGLEAASETTTIHGHRMSSMTFSIEGWE